MQTTLSWVILGVWGLMLGQGGIAHSDDDFSSETMKATQITPKIFMLEGAGGNITASIGSDGVLLIDDDFAPMAEKLLEKLKQLQGGRPRVIVNTHFHYDHTGGNEIFGSTATLIAATEVRDRLMSEQILWHKPHPPVPTQALPMITFTNSLSLNFNQEKVQLRHLRHGHTDGDTVAIFEQSKVVSLGDLYFSNMYPIFHPEHGGSLGGLLENVETIIQTIPDDAKIVPGHGPLSTKAQLREYAQMIRATIAIVSTGIDQGLSLAQIQHLGLPAQWEPFSHGYRTTDQWLQSVYESLKAKK